MEDGFFLFTRCSVDSVSFSSSHDSTSWRRFLCAVCLLKRLWVGAAHQLCIDKLISKLSFITGETSVSAVGIDEVTLTCQRFPQDCVGLWRVVLHGNLQACSRGSKATFELLIKIPKSYVKNVSINCRKMYKMYASQMYNGTLYIR